MMMRKTLISIAALVIITACASSGRAVERGQPFTRDAVAEGTIRVHVQNDNFMDARLYAIGSSSRQHLGIVVGKQQAVLEIPWDFSKPLRIEIDLLAGPKCTTDTIEADPGDILDLRIESVLSRSAACS
ncbi:MAG: hypothetical protein VX956_16065 [Gemmatimonadota bacterium]|nr:hypothetical protein [Gemmatimonadota bacterium]